ncbi:hypothetical protein AJ78_06446 [Emergomyces pasteurianus Ep9510]|uniref:N-acetyltransferase domain-containing protein n=1 Tax=Emergomyces pasteurianus Ep9510 TaxID=1447872 RepID=A0A1J9PAH4_9EURO|nr:hypothetical protein AJ78_06446 [Emergomyces pasteurianus Ep9510]
MLINEKIAISSSRVLLVPYSKHHVPRYHEWMKDPELQQATASEPLTLEEEYAMQTSWRTDADKLTFIICLPLHESLSSFSLPTDGMTGVAAVDVQTSQLAEFISTTTVLTDPNIDSPAAMLGDVNLFLRLDEDEEGDSNSHLTATTDAGARVIGEMELMIAEKAKQGKSFGKAGLVCFLKYIAEHEVEIVGGFLSSLSACSAAVSGANAGAGPADGEKQEERVIGNKLAYLSAKIGADNVRSLALFESLGFAKMSEEPNVFGELELRRGSLRGNEGEELLRRYGVEGYTEMVYER